MKTVTALSQTENQISSDWRVVCYGTAIQSPQKLRAKLWSMEQAEREYFLIFDTRR